jgi:hypothetical protein
MGFYSHQPRSIYMNFRFGGRRAVWCGEVCA